MLLTSKPCMGEHEWMAILVFLKLFKWLNKRNHAYRYVYLDSSCLSCQYLCVM